MYSHNINWIKKASSSFPVIVMLLICGCLLVDCNKEVLAKPDRSITNTSRDITPELRIKIDGWMKLLYSDDPEMRSSAIISLLGLNQPSVYGPLIDILRKSDNDDVRVSLIKSFGFAGDDKALDCIIELLASENEDIRNAASNALGNMKSSKAVERMIYVLQNQRNSAGPRILIASALAKTRSRDAVEPLIGLLDSENIELRQAAQNSLLEITKQSNGYNKSFWREWWATNRIKTREQWLEDIVNKLEEDVKVLKEQNQSLRSNIARQTIKVLQSRKDKDDIKPLLEAVQSGYLEVRVFAAGELVKHKGPEAIKVFSDLILDGNPDTRILASKAIGEIGDISGLGPLKTALKDEVAKVKEYAAKAMGKLGSEEATDDLISALNNKEPSVICAVAEALGEIKSKDAVGPLVELISNEDPVVKEYAIVALGKIQDLEAVGPLIESLKDEGERIRWYAADSLGKIGEKEAVPHLITLLSDKSPRVRESTVMALGQIGGENAVGSLINLLKDKDERVAERTADILLTIECKNIELLDRIANIFYEEKDYNRAIEIFKKQIDGFKNIPEQSIALWTSKLKLAKSYFLLNNCQEAVPLYAELTLHFEDDIEIKHELTHCLKETKQFDKLLNFYSIWIANLLTDNHLWWRGMCDTLEMYFKEGKFDKVRSIVDNFEKKNRHMGGPEIKTEIQNLRMKSVKALSLKKEMLPETPDGK